MADYVFHVQRRGIPGTHLHEYIAVDQSDGTAIQLPDGGTGGFLGQYPEIESHLKLKQLNVTLRYTRSLGDTVDLDHQAGRYTWTYQRQGHRIIVIDVPRAILTLTVTRP